MQSLKRDGHKFVDITLHTNYGTFKPVECDDITEHPMHAEEYSISEKNLKIIQSAKKSKKSVVAVGTTSCRLLETMAQINKRRGSTDIFIYPGYEFQMVDALITNFHLPMSTLLMLVYAFGGKTLMKKAYQEAIKKEYRFYSYGDAMIII